MNYSSANQRLPGFLTVLLMLHFSVYASIFFNIPIARQIFGFIYFSFVPGFAMIRLLGMDELDRLETILFSSGFSISFLMIGGLLINEFGMIFGFSRPLSLSPLVLILTTLTLLFGVLAHLRSRNVEFWNSIPFHARSSSTALFLVCLPILSIVGAMLVYVYGNNLVLLVMLAMLSAFFGLVVITKNLLPSKLFPILVFFIAISLLFHASLISNRLVSFGSDVEVESFISKTTLESARWNSTLAGPTTSGFWYDAYGRLNDMLSIAVLPSVYSVLLNLDITWIFKILFPMVFSFVPVGLYVMWRRYLGHKYALVSAFLLMAQLEFSTEMLGLNRQMVGELFLTLLLSVVLATKLKSMNKAICFVVFSIGLIVSHYALAEIFLFFISFLAIASTVWKKRIDRWIVSMLVLFFVLMFSWYIYTSASTVFDSFLSFGSSVTSQLGEFFDFGSRGTTVLRGLGMEAAPSIWNAFSRVFAYLLQGFIVVGFFALLLKRTKIRFDTNYFLLTSAATFLLAALILVPGLANTLNMTRFYHILLFFLSPLFTIGVEVVAKSILRQKKELAASLLMLAVLIPYFLFQIGFIYELAGTQSYSLSLSKHQMSEVFLRRRLGYFSEPEVYGASWIARNVRPTNSEVYVDSVSLSMLVGYGMLRADSMGALSNTTLLSRDDCLYLGRVNLVDSLVISSYVWNTSNVSEIWMTASTIYSNGESEIHKNSLP